MDGLSIAASALQVADLGFRLAKNICTYAKDVRSAAADLHNVGTDLDILAKVRKQLHTQLDLDHQSRFYTAEGREGAYENLRGCRQAFGEIGGFLSEFLKVDADGRARLSKVAMMMYPLKRGRMEVLRANLERLKSTMVLNLSVLSLRGQISVHGQHVDFSLTRLQIESMVKANEEMARRFDEMKKAYKVHCDRFNQQSGAGATATSMSAMVVPNGSTGDRSLSGPPGDFSTPSVAPPPRTDAKRTKVQLSRRSDLDQAARYLPVCVQAVTTLAVTVATATFTLQTTQIMEMGKLNEDLEKTVNTFRTLDQGLSQDSAPYPQQAPHPIAPTGAAALPGYAVPSYSRTDPSLYSVGPTRGGRVRLGADSLSQSIATTAGYEKREKAVKEEKLRREAEYQKKENGRKEWDFPTMPHFREGKEIGEVTEAEHQKKENEGMEGDTPYPAVEFNSPGDFELGDGLQFYAQQPSEDQDAVDKNGAFEDSHHSGPQHGEEGKRNRKGKKNKKSEKGMQDQGAFDNNGAFEDPFGGGPAPYEGNPFQPVAQSNHPGAFGEEPGYGDRWEEAPQPHGLEFHSSGLGVVDELLYRWTKAY